MKNQIITSSFYLIHGFATMSSTSTPFKIGMCTQQVCSIKILMRFEEALLFKGHFYDFETTPPTTKITELHNINAYLSTCHNECQGIICLELDLAKVIMHPSMHMYIVVNIKHEFQQATQPFSKEWDEFEFTINENFKDPPNLEVAKKILHSYSTERHKEIEKLDALLSKLSIKHQTKAFLKLICNSNITTYAMQAEEQLFFNAKQKFKDFLIEFQSYFLQHKIF